MPKDGLHNVLSKLHLKRINKWENLGSYKMVNCQHSFFIRTAKGLNLQDAEFRRSSDFGTVHDGQCNNYLLSQNKINTEPLIYIDTFTLSSSKTQSTYHLFSYVFYKTFVELQVQENPMPAPSLHPRLLSIVHKEGGPLQNLPGH